jgi:hypothetical protein
VHPAPGGQPVPGVHERRGEVPEPQDLEMHPHLRASVRFGSTP